MGDELATANVNRSYSLFATSIAILTFTLIFLYPMFEGGEIDARLFLVPSPILLAIGLLAVGGAWFALWLVYLLFVIRYFPKVQTARGS